MNDRYVYVLKDGDNIFYVGKGTRAPAYSNPYRRPLEHVSEAVKDPYIHTNKRKCAYINNMLSSNKQVGVDIVADNLTEQEAISLETSLIQKYGRIEDGGVLTNLVTKQELIAHERRTKPVYCFTKTGELFKFFDSVKQAAVFFNTSPGIIVSCCRGKYKTASGMVWSYDNTFPGYAKPSPWNKRAVDCYSLDGVLLSTYSSGCEAERITGVIESSINACVRGEAFSAGGMRWAEHGKHIINNTQATSSVSGRKRRKVGQYDMNGNLIQVFDVVTDAISATGHSGIYQVLCGRLKTAGGYVWKYLEDDK